jgi:RNA polymerase sigma-70 factor (ECF subfamily)
LKALLKYSGGGCPAAMDVSGAVTKPASVVVSLTQIYDAYFDFVWRNARMLGVSEDSADDVVQDVFVVVHLRIHDFDGRTQLRAWIFGILVRVARAHHRSFQRKGALTLGEWRKCKSGGCVRAAQLGRPALRSLLPGALIAEHCQVEALRAAA